MHRFSQDRRLFEGGLRPVLQEGAHGLADLDWSGPRRLSRPGATSLPTPLDMALPLSLRAQESIQKKFQDFWRVVVESLRGADGVLAYDLINAGTPQRARGS